ncbi:MAG: PTS sugar transporter subunit IIA [Acidiferrobacterales bacterium]
MKVNDILTPARIELAMRAASKKRALEGLSELIAADTNLNSTVVFQSLIDRERIGSTGIGENIAIPHGRLKGLDQPVGAFTILEQQIDFDAIDQKPVNIIFALVVPEEATDEHLQLLAQLAKIFSNKEAKEKLLGASSPEEALLLFKEFNANQAVA